MRPDLIIFDCDGVLIDSESIASKLIAQNLTTLGWPMTTEDSMALFLGMSIVDMEPIIETRLGRRLPEGWRSEIAAEFLEAFGREVTLIPGARATLEQVNRLGIPWRVATNSSDEELAVKFAHTGLDDLTAGLTHTAGSVIAKGGRPKPAPDVYLQASDSANVAPSRCVVLEDSALGVTGAVAAGMVCYGFAPHGDGAHLSAAGAVKILHSLDEFLHLLESVDA
jgi:HAD superfamily hydrolase (TIGR01509 family)